MMRKILTVRYFLLFTLYACGIDGSQQYTSSFGNEQALIYKQGQTIETRFITPEGFQRVETATHSFADYLRKLPLKPHHTQVKLYNGETKNNDGIYDAVVDLEIGNKDLHQCADAVMRLRAEHLWQQKQYDKIHFNFTNGFRVDYSEWIEGKRIKVEGNSTSWVQSQAPSNSYEDFWNYLEIIFTYAGTISLSKELKPIPMEDIQIGDVFIIGGSPGHAVIVVDLAIDETNNQRIFLLAQSYMPAQEIQILKNPNDANISPWYRADFENQLVTPEWTFDKSHLKRFAD